jgi:hypothetical protein
MRKLILNLVGFVLIALAIALVAANASGTAVNPSGATQALAYSDEPNQPDDDAERMILCPSTVIRLADDPNQPDDDAERILCSCTVLLLDDDPNDDDAERTILCPGATIPLIDDPNQPDDDAERM